jgi:7-keto-8-aminopelargonate synthetase-like enzyme
VIDTPDVYVACCTCCTVLLCRSVRSMSTPLELTGRTQRCLNLGSYNYLGFAAADEYCTPRVLDTLAECGVSTCSPRTEAGACSCAEQRATV